MDRSKNSGNFPPEYDNLAVARIERLYGPSSPPQEPLSAGRTVAWMAALMAGAMVAGEVESRRPEVDLSDGVSTAELGELYSRNESVWDFSRPEQ